MMNTTSLIATCVVISILMSDLRASAAAKEVPPTIAPTYAPDRKMLASDFVRADWHDAARNRDVPAKIYFPSDAAGPFPVIIFSHGLGGTREGYEYLARQWAANGYVSMHLQHIGSDDSAWRGKEQPMQTMRQAANLQNSTDRPKDVQLAVEQLIETITIIGPPASFISPGGAMNFYLGGPLFIIFFLGLGVALSLQSAAEEQPVTGAEPHAPGPGSP